VAQDVGRVQVPVPQKTNKQTKNHYAGGGGEGAQTIYTHVSNCKNDKIKGEKNHIMLSERSPS
jgi:hypothetical protein